MSSKEQSLKEEQSKIGQLMRKWGMSFDTDLRHLLFHEEVGELTKELNKARKRPNDEKVNEEFGDVLFDLLALAEAAGIDAEAALATTVSKLSDRFDQHGSVTNPEKKNQ